MRTSKKKTNTDDGRTWKEGFRWCEKEGRYVAVKVCESMARKEKRCLRCYNEYLQLPLQFPGIKAG